MVTIEDLNLDITPAGLSIAAISVVSSGLQQIFVRTMQQKHKLNSYELLSNTAPPQVGARRAAGAQAGSGRLGAQARHTADMSDGWWQCTSQSREEGLCESVVNKQEIASHPFHGSASSCHLLPARLQAWTLLFVGPFIDKLVSSGLCTCCPGRC